MKMVLHKRSVKTSKNVKNQSLLKRLRLLKSGLFQQRFPWKHVFGLRTTEPRGGGEHGAMRGSTRRNTTFRLGR